MNASWVQKSRILGQIEDHVAEGGGFDPCLLLNDQIDVLMEEKTGHAAALENLMSECQKVSDNVKGLFELRTQLVVAGINL